MKISISALILVLSAACACAAPSIAGKPEGTVVVPADAALYASAIWEEDKKTASIEKIAVTGAPFTSALRLTVTQPSPEAWQIGTATKTSAPVQKGDVLWVPLAARSIESLEPTGEAYADIVFRLKDVADKEVRPLERLSSVSSHTAAP